MVLDTHGEPNCIIYIINEGFKSGPENNDAEEHAKEVERLRENFSSFFDPAYSSREINDFAEEILRKVRSGEVTWDELEFTEKDLEEGLRIAELDRDEDAGEHF